MKLLKIKVENVLALLYLPLGISNITKANADYLLLSIIMQATLIGGFILAVKIGRHELIRDIKEGYYNEEIEELEKAIASFRRTKGTIENAFKRIKKEVIGSKLKTTKLKDAF